MSQKSYARCGPPKGRSLSIFSDIVILKFNFSDFTIKSTLSLHLVKLVKHHQWSHYQILSSSPKCCKRKPIDTAAGAGGWTAAMLLGLTGRWSRKVAGPMDIIDIHWQYVYNETNRSFMSKSGFMRCMTGNKIDRVPVDVTKARSRSLAEILSEDGLRRGWLECRVY